MVASASSPIAPPVVVVAPLPTAPPNVAEAPVPSSIPPSFVDPNDALPRLVTSFSNSCNACLIVLLSLIIPPLKLPRPCEFLLTPLSVIRLVILITFVSAIESVMSKCVSKFCNAPLILLLSRIILPLNSPRSCEFSLAPLSVIRLLTDEALAFVTSAFVVAVFIGNPRRV